MIAFRFTQYEESNEQAPFERLLQIFLELLTYTSGEVAEALNWLNELDKELRLTTTEYPMVSFIEDLKKKGYLRENRPGGQGLVPTAKTEQGIRERALEQIFGKLKKGGRGNHSTTYTGAGDEWTANQKPYEFGDSIDQVALTESIQNAQVNHGIDGFSLLDSDLIVREQEHKSQTSTVVMIDISHSMILYGEDRITPAKKVAMGLAELIRRKYPKDTVNFIVFGNDAWEVQLKDLPYLQVGPYHTNTVAGLELAMDLLRRKKNANKQIFMITDGKPTCLKVGISYYKNSWGLDKRIIEKTTNLAAQCRKLHIPITTFMVAQDPWLVQFVRDFTKANGGKAYFTGLGALGEFVFEDYERNRRRTLKQ
ncbi:MAG: VWA domain-containing protein [Bacteroidetes bacterium]|jgi:uncharacterized protein with von Willebrand factor type A (vWA) domain|nr:VWA domain-containing protein [Bacteroidota bacterium]